jgi:N-acyl-D-amino-acid deacylase
MISGCTQELEKDSITMSKTKFVWRGGKWVTGAAAWLLAACPLLGQQPDEFPRTTPPLDQAAVVQAPVLERAVLATGVEDERLRSFDQLMLTIIREEEVPGAALAVVRDGKLVYARGFGMRDVENHLPVMPTSLFRIASLSKPITAVAVMQLVEREAISLDDRVFEILAVEAHRENEEGQLDDRLEQITIRQLLHHTAGWDRDASFDPMFQSVRIADSLGLPPPARTEPIIRFMKGHPLDFEPGERYAYSNFGYCLVGRIIEAKTDLSYEQYVRQHIFSPLGLAHPRLGQTRTTNSFEVKYYDSSESEGESVFAEDLGKAVPHPYGAWCLEAMDAHGGWIASAVDLVRFSSAVHAGDSGGVLSDASIAQLFQRPQGAAGQNGDGTPRDTYYGLGWQVRPVGESGDINCWHTGSLPGTWTLLVHRHDGLHWALLLNTRKDRKRKDNLMTRLDRQLHEAADAVAQWPDEDQFPLYRPPAGEAPK